VRRIVCRVVSGYVARSAVRGQAFVYAAGMATIACDADMFSGERECCLRSVVEFPVRPGDGVVARRANGRRKAGLDVRRIRRGVELINVAAAASRGGVGITSARMALRALQSRVRIGQREELGVIEGCLVPSRGGVAGRAGGGREACLRVRRIVRGIVLRHVAGGAIRRCACEFAIDVAQVAGHIYVLPDQREIGELVVVKRGVEPRCRVVAGLALLRETRLHVRGIVCLIEIRGVASVAIRRCAFELAVDVAGRAFQGRMCTG